jgi:D-alanyl-D-alanine carboxypeptidase (penicillin-binding protein 5/6)
MINCVSAETLGPVEEGSVLTVNETDTSDTSDTSLAANASSAILIDASTGEVLFEKNSHEKMAPASMTKMMSMLLIIEAIENDVIGWDDIITVSQNASDMGGSQILLETGEQMSVYDLFKGIAVASGNDAVVALAEAVAGTEEEFVKMMNDKVKELGLKDTNFKNVHGLDEANHYSSAYDMAMIGKELASHEKIFEFTSIYEDYLRKGTDREFWLVNTNKLVRFYTGVDGLKTGYTSEAGYCLTATAKKNDMRLIAVAMGEPSSTSRNADITSMLDYGFAQYKVVSIIKKTEVITEVEVERSQDEKIEIVPINDVSILTKKTDKLGEITYDITLNKLKSPIKVGDVVGKLTIKEDGNKIKEVDLTVKEDVNKANLWELYKRYLIKLITGNIKF